MTFEEADRRFGTDKPDTRFGLEIEDATEVTRSSEFGVFKGADAVRFPACRRSTRAATSRSSRSWRRSGGEGLAYLVYDEEGEVRSPIAKFLSEQELAHFRSDPGTTVLLRRRRLAGDIARPRSAAQPSRPGARPDRRGRVHVPLGLRLPDVRARRGRGPLDGRAPPVHAADRRLEGLVRRRPRARARARVRPDRERQQLGGGSFRIHEPEIQAKVFELLGLEEEEQRSKFGFLLDAPAMGAPPMGGIALGIDRMTMVLAGEPNLRDVIAFPKNQAGVDPDERRAVRGDAGTARRARNTLVEQLG